MSRVMTMMNDDDVDVVAVAVVCLLDQ